MFDSHIHTSFSTDSKMLLEDAIREADYKNLGIIVTEHMDLKYPKENRFFFNPKEYFKSYDEYRNDKVLLGMEMGLRPDCINENRELVNNYPFDFIIGSIHVVNGLSVYNKKFYLDREKDDTYIEYLRYMYDCVKMYDFYDSLGHIDYLCRYVSYADSEIYYNDYHELIDAILGVLVDKGKVLEINTDRFGSKAAVENMTTIYKRFYELGGRYVTLGSDSHCPEPIGQYFSTALEAANYCKLKVGHFKERKLIID